MHRVRRAPNGETAGAAFWSPSSTCCHTFRATGITADLENGGTIENAQLIAAHEPPRTTKPTTTTSERHHTDEIERIAISGRLSPCGNTP